MRSSTKTFWTIRKWRWEILRLFLLTFNHLNLNHNNYVVTKNLLNIFLLLSGADVIRGRTQVVQVPTLLNFAALEKQSKNVMLSAVYRPLRITIQGTQPMALCKKGVHK